MGGSHESTAGNQNHPNNRPLGEGSIRIICLAGTPDFPGATPPFALDRALRIAYFSGRTAPWPSG